MQYNEFFPYHYRQLLVLMNIFIIIILNKMTYIGLKPHYGVLTRIFNNMLLPHLSIHLGLSDITVT